MFSRSFSCWFSFTHFFAKITIRWCLTATAKLPANSTGYFCCRHSGCLKRVFHWLAAWPRWQLLWWSVISFQNFRSLKLRHYFCMDFLASSELIGYVDFTDSYEIWPKCSLVIIAKNGVRLFWYSQYFSFYALSWRRSANIHFANFKIDFLGKQSECWKSLTPFCSLSTTDWHCAVCLVILVSRKAGNSV